MDSFAKLPLELILQALTYLKDYVGAFKAIQTSPVLFRRGANCARLHAAFIRRHLHGSAVQDALAIIQFPRQASQHERDTRRAALIQSHLMTWGAGGLVDPCSVAHPDLARFRELHSFCRRLRAYIDDYLSKATSVHFEWAFLYLPRWSHSDYRKISFINKIPANIGDFDVEGLSGQACLKIYRAFMQYEILCKVYGPITEESLLEDDLRQTSSNSINPERPPYLSSWDWELLSRYRPGDHTLADVSSLKCVREYIITLYEGMINYGFLSKISFACREYFRHILPDAGSSIHSTADSHMLRHIWLCAGERWHSPPSRAIIEAVEKILIRHPFSSMPGGGDWAPIRNSFMSSAGFDAVHSILAMGGDDSNGLLERQFSGLPEHLP
ncbi:uncharacterized protein F5Z01DRAFT_750250 [Emericellopsis atlantica]|uniref:Uncharacterized protein n=1 Tax=Emericellopsis atlantica TaxID=2614577 RepID=A0A9P7ZMR7_9HYPO|nr:uncharacterized protein F5Z01DRAFT_750250 [Emericellopsis atlantica]KAG9254343.1 hypothetical protein F5Z01DRAFT_750250 [Emericellopsis atlantica]